jgi:ubiquinone biosynthesis protein UbiJ
LKPTPQNFSKQEQFYIATAETTVLLEQLADYVAKPTCDDMIVTGCVTQREIDLVYNVAQHLHSTVRVAVSLKFRDEEDTSTALNTLLTANSLAATQLLKLKGE